MILSGLNSLEKSLLDNRENFYLKPRSSRLLITDHTYVTDKGKSIGKIIFALSQTVVMTFQLAKTHEVIVYLPRHLLVLSRGLLPGPNR